MRHILIESESEAFPDSNLITHLIDRNFVIGFGALHEARPGPQIVIVNVHIELTPDRLQRLQALVASGSILAGPWALSICSNLELNQDFKSGMALIQDRFKSVIITTTGVDSLTIDYISLLVTCLGCEIDRNFTQDTTHLIVQTVGTAKHFAALTTKKPCLTIQWILKCFEEGALTPEGPFAVPALFNCIVSVSQLSLSERTTIKDIVEQHGGTYCSGLSHDCTHLICREPHGDKFNFAKQWGIPIVQESWLDAMLQNMGCTNISEYLLEVPHRLQPEPVSPTEAITEISPRNPLYFDHIEYDCDCDDYLSGCVVVLAGFTDDRLYNQLCSILQYGGATRLNQMRPFVTHAVVSHLGAGSMSANHCRSVNYQWLFDCYKAKACVPITEAHRPLSIQPADDQNLFRSNRLVRSSSLTAAAVDATEGLTVCGTSKNVSITAPTNFSLFNQSIDKNNSSNKRRKMVWR